MEKVLVNPVDVSYQCFMFYHLSCSTLRSSLCWFYCPEVKYKMWHTHTLLSLCGKSLALCQTGSLWWLDVVSLQDSSQHQRHSLLHWGQSDGRGRVGVHLDEVSLVQRRFREEDPAGGSDLLGQHLPPQQVRTTPMFVFVLVRTSDALTWGLFLEFIASNVIDQNFKVIV